MLSYLQEMIADKNVYMENASQTMYELSGDELVQRQCRARRDYYKQINTHNKTLCELEEANKTIEQLQKRIEELEAQQK